MAGYKGRRGNNFPFLAEDFRRLPRSADEGISALFRGGATKVGNEKTGKIGILICLQSISIIYSNTARRELCTHNKGHSLFDASCRFYQSLMLQFTVP